MFHFLWPILYTGYNIFRVVRSSGAITWIVYSSLAWNRRRQACNAVRWFGLTIVHGWRWVKHCDWWSVSLEKIAVDRPSVAVDTDITTIFGDIQLIRGLSATNFLRPLRATKMHIELTQFIISTQSDKLTGPTHNDNECKPFARAIFDCVMRTLLCWWTWDLHSCASYITY